MHEIYRFYNKKIDGPVNKKKFLISYEKILITMMPIIPHFASECLETVNKDIEIYWPKLNKEFLKNNTHTIVIQINGKKRDILTINKNLDKEELLDMIIKKPNCSKYLQNKEMKRTIYIKNKLINIIV